MEAPKTTFRAIVKSVRNGRRAHYADIGITFIGRCSPCRPRSHLGIVPELEPRPDHAVCVASWLTILSNDKRAILTAAAHAQRAVAYLHSLQPQPESEREAGCHRAVAHSTMLLGARRA